MRHQFGLGWPRPQCLAQGWHLVLEAKMWGMVGSTGARHLIPHAKSRLPPRSSIALPCDHSRSAGPNCG